MSGHGTAAAQSLSLDQALRRAETAAYGNRIAAADARAQAGEALKPLRGVLPAVRVEAGWARTTDPIGVFGTTLRQRIISQADFDPARLNFPDPVSNWTAGLVLEQPLLNADAHLGRRAAARASVAAREASVWARSATAQQVVAAYYGAVLARERVSALESAREAAQAHVKQARSLAEQGVVTKADALLAQVRAGEVDAQLVEARGDAALAVRRLALVLGDPADTAFALPSALPAAERIRSLEGLDWTGAADARADVRAAVAGRDAARADAQRARAQLLPRVNALARYDWNSADNPFAGDEAWSVGVVASWTPFSGASELGDTRATAARADAARARADAARAQAELEIAAAANAWAVALERLGIAETALDQSVEAHRIVSRMYAGGTATATELLGAAATETGTRLRLAAARFEAIQSAAARLHALGRSAHELAAALAE